MERLVHGIGINDANYLTRWREGGKSPICPYYSRWVNMITRCYSEKSLIKSPTYRGCEVCSDWLSFMSFREWMSYQKWHGKQLDKDLLFYGNKLYSPDKCVFVTSEVNSFVADRAAARGKQPIGVSFEKNKRKYKAMCSDVTTGKNVSLGYYDDPLDAHHAWLSFKLNQAYILADRQEDERVANALIDRYKNYRTDEAKP